MSVNNTDAKSLLLEAQIIVTNKFTVFSTDQDIDKDKLAKLQKKIDNEIERFKQPEVWLLPLVLDRTKVFSCLLKIHAVKAPNLDELTTQVDTLIGILDESLSNANESTENTESDTDNESNRNLEALAALQNIRRKVLGRSRFFMARGIDLATNDDYQALRNRQKPLIKTYSEKLQEESIIENEINVILLNGCANAIQGAKELEPFFKHFDEVSDFVEQRLQSAEA